jgi:hypothetical protein
MCILHVSARGKHKRRRKGHENSATNDADDSAAAIATTVDSGGPAAVAQVLFALSTGGLPVENASSDSSPPQRRSTDFVDATGGSRMHEEDDEPKLPMYVGKLECLACKIPRPATNTSIGDLQSLRYIFHVAQTDKAISNKSHYLVAKPQRRRLSPEETSYLKARGAFDLQSFDLRRELISCFFDYVYPLCPIIDPCDFWQVYNPDDPDTTSLLLLQSMYVAACNVSEYCVQ